MSQKADVSKKFALNSKSKPILEELVALGLHPVEAEIVSRLHADAVQLASAPDSQWTKKIRETLIQIGTRDESILCFPNNLSGEWEKGGEWIFDLAWVKCPKDESGNFDWRNSKGIVLACESEWLTGQNYVLEDFFKLTFVRADYRLFIYTYTDEDKNGQHPVDWCKNVCPDSINGTPTDRYLAIGFPRSLEDFYLDLWIR